MITQDATKQYRHQPSKDLGGSELDCSVAGNDIKQNFLVLKECLSIERSSVDVDLAPG